MSVEKINPSHPLFVAAAIMFAPITLLLMFLADMRDLKMKRTG